MASEVHFKSLADGVHTLSNRQDDKQVDQKMQSLCRRTAYGKVKWRIECSKSLLFQLNGMFCQYACIDAGLCSAIAI